MRWFCYINFPSRLKMSSLTMSYLKAKRCTRSDQRRQDILYDGSLDKQDSLTNSKEGKNGLTFDFKPVRFVWKGPTTWLMIEAAILQLHYRWSLCSSFFAGDKISRRQSIHAKQYAFLFIPGLGIENNMGVSLQWEANYLCDKQLKYDLCLCLLRFYTNVFLQSFSSGSACPNNFQEKPTD